MLERLPISSGVRFLFPFIPPLLSRSVNAGSHWLTLVNNKKNSPENSCPRKRKLVNRVNLVQKRKKAPPFKHLSLKSPKTFGHSNICDPTAQNPAPFKHFRDEFYTLQLATMEADK
jgi:hypothetical protein